MRPSLAIAASTAGLLFFPGLARAETLTLPPVADTYVRNGANQNANFGTGVATYLEFTEGPTFSRTYYRFDLSAIPASSTIESASLAWGLYSYSVDNATYTFSMLRAGGPWTETGLTWNSQPTPGEVLESRLVNSSIVGTWNLTDAVRHWVDGSWANDGVVIRTTEGVGDLVAYGFWSREAAEPLNRPSLTVTYTPIVPPAPATTTLAITGVSHAAVATAATVSFTTSQAAVATIEYGPTASYGSSKTETDAAGVLHAVTLTGLTPGATYHYRVRATAGSATATGEDRTFTTPSAGTIAPGTLVKTADSPAVYYVGSDGKRHAFPNDRIYKSWYADFSAIQTVSATAMAALPLGANVTYRPGLRMVKFATLPKVYAVGPKGELRWVATEAIASSLYGASWNTLIDDLSDAFFVNYRYGADIATASDFSPAAQTAAVTTIDQNL